MSDVIDRFDADRFEASRDRLASLAYRLLGSASEAEDAVQDAYLRWQCADRQRIDVPEAWLTKVVTNLSLDRLRSAHRRNERASAWLPEPVLDGDPMLGPAETVEQREMVSLAVLALMERLSPAERGVYVLREAFSYAHAEIAEVLEISESASQQHLHRARRRIAAGRQRGVVEVDPASARKTVEAFLQAASSGDTDRLVALLTDDATAVSDGAGSGISERLLRYDTPRKIAAIARTGFRPTPAKRRLAGGTPAFHYALVNGTPAMLAVVDDRVVGVVAFDVLGGKIATVRGIASPKRLARLDAAWTQQEPGSPIIAEW
ncbi:sigma-70 family RNA polymerase sigma factor [Nocardioides sp. NPDC023903]|uniref:sigma-70 family RNA polymerase sigma factor n=1 Tax=Nocardioides sp. NPDC023903 TaxID=3157195 RepID=UPI0033D35F90